MKQKVSALDLQLLVAELRNSIESYRLNNIYNITDSSKQYLLKFNKPDSKVNVIVDCGSRIHITEYARQTPTIPSNFVVKLRKHLKSRRLTNVRQISNDRIVVFQFADGQYYLVFEFFSAGNILLLDENLKILSLQRIVKEYENAVGKKYEMFDHSLFSNHTSIPTITDTKFNTSLINSWFQEEKTHLETSPVPEKKKTIHRLLLNKVPYLSSDLLTKNLKMNGITPSEQSSAFFSQEDVISNVLKQTQKEYSELLQKEVVVGYIVTQKNSNYIKERDSVDLEYVFDSFHPFKPYINATEDKKIIEVEGSYNKTLDTFFSTIESSKYALKIQAQENMAQKKLDDARFENAKRIQTLQNMQLINEKKGHLIIEHANEIEEAKCAIQGLIDQQLDWNTIEKLIKAEKKKKNKIAEMIMLPLNLNQNKIDIKLPNAYRDHYSSSYEENTSSDSSENSDSDDEIQVDVKKSISHAHARSKINNNKNYVVVTIDLTLSAYANASEYFNLRKTTAEKQKKVEQNIEKAMKNIEKNVNQQLKRKLEKSHNILKKVKNPYFFEKYYWFISSEGFLVLMGKSALESDQIYGKYIEEDDIFVSNSYDNVVWIKNPEKSEIPPNTLMQAGMLCMASSEVWLKKLAASAWWCKAKNISKFNTYDNNVLPAGVFTIKDENEKNILAPSQLVMGLGLMWKVKTLNDITYTEDGTFPSTNHESVETKSVFENEISEEYPSSFSETNNDSPPLESVTKKSVDTLFTRNESKMMEKEEKETTEENSTSATAADVLINMKKNVRGKKGKLKKMQKKYKDQDESERIMRLEALGTLKGIEMEEKRKQEESTKKYQQECRKERREKQKMAQLLHFTTMEKVKINFVQLKEQLRPCISKEDEVLDIIPVFAPWPALLKYKYKVKIQPGNAKKTKTMNEILSFFLNRQVDTTKNDNTLDWPMEHDMIKALTTQDLVSIVSVDKVSASLNGSKNGKTKSHNKGKGTKAKGKNTK